MLTDLQIHNFLIIESLDLSLKEGMTVVTGETGAGKSILLDALQFVTGARADSNWVREGSSGASVSAQFGETVLKRMLGQDGRSKAYINGELVSVQELKTLGASLLNWVGQYEHQRLLKTEAQMVALDRFAQAESLLAEVTKRATKLSELFKGLADLNEQQKAAGAANAFKQYQLEILKELALTENEWESLQEEHKKLASSGELMSKMLSLLNQLHEEEQNIESQTQSLAKQIQGLAADFKELQNPAHLLAEASVNLNEAYYELKGFYESLDLDPERLIAVEARISLIHSTARKLQLGPEALFAYYQTLLQECEGGESIELKIKAQEAEIAQEKAVYLSKAEDLSRTRQNAALKLAIRVSSEMKTLGMKEAEFRVALSVPEGAGKTLFSAVGLDKIEFEVRMNPGQKWGDLKESASGGELSRIALVIAILNASQDEAQTLIFDEVDVGVSGAVAEKVGGLLKALGQQAQVICITHLPQVALMGDQHIHISKVFKGGQTFGSARTLTLDERAEEIARIMSGEHITEHARKLAREQLGL